MRNVMKFGKYAAVISYDPEIRIFRGEFVGLNGVADFYADDIEKLRQEGTISLRVFLDYAHEKNTTPKKQYSGKRVLRLKPELHQKYQLLAASKKVSLSHLLNETLEQTL